MKFVRRRLMFESALEMIEADVRAAGAGHELSLSIDERFSIVPCKEGALYLAGRELDAENHADAVIELADIVQYEVIDVLMTPWPWCNRHNSIANPQVKDDIPVWWCESGEHTLYRIGGIGLQSLFRVAVSRLAIVGMTDSRRGQISLMCGEISSSGASG